jgi:murein DD-endopeptidase MepM/ murein hydrolase activator NlpD
MIKVEGKYKRFLVGFALIGVLLGCNLPTTEFGDGAEFISKIEATPQPKTSFFSFLPVRSDLSQPIPSPTPDPSRNLEPIRVEPIEHIVQPNDTLGKIANRYAVTLDELIAANNITDPNLLSVGEVLIVPAPFPGAPAPDLKLIPDSEVVNGPYNAFFDLHGYIQEKGGQLAIHQEEVDGAMLGGAQIVELVSTNYSVNPRLLLALLDYQTGWLSHPQVHLDSLSFPMGNPDPYRSNLYLQLTWAADTLNAGYYRWRANALSYYRSADGVLIPASPQINAGTAALHYFFAQLQDEAAWRHTISANGFIQTFQSLYGYAFDWGVEPVVPPSLAQPSLRLPFENGVSWVFTGGPHGGWDDGSAWAALDFAPSSEQLGCVQKDEWVVAAADGLIVRAEDGAVVQDLDGDGFEHTGWTIFYMHIDTRDRVAVGTYLSAGERIGHPSCEGGFSTGTHLHIARRYNGEWIAINGPIPFVMDGWMAVDTGKLYGGYLQNGEKIVEPCECRDIENMIQR